MRADIVIDVGSHELVANTANQLVWISIVSTDVGVDPLVKGVSLNAQIGDGGVIAGGTTEGPKFQAVDLINGTIFESSNEGQVSSVETDYLQVWELNTASSQPEVAASGLLVTLTIDTTGYFDGEFDLQLKSTANGSTEFPIQGDTLIPTISDGSIVITGVPEPSSCLVLGFSFATVLFRRRRFAIAADLRRSSTVSHHHDRNAIPDGDSHCCDYRRGQTGADRMGGCKYQRCQHHYQPEHDVSRRSRIPHHLQWQNHDVVQKLQPC